MTRRKTPKGEKQKDYDRQHVSPGKHDKGFRRQWPRKKARVERAYRRGAKQVLDRFALEDEASLDAGLSAKRTSIEKWETISLGERIKRKLARRKATVGARKQRRGQ